jgi:tRNA-dihydrouridine synthase
MNFYLAPMEGLSGYIYRNAHNAYFNNIDKYFSPFISANQTGKLKSRELSDILPENNKGLVLVPQLLTNVASNFINVSKYIESLGYKEINLNLGCPFGTVVSKNKGSGFLAETDKLDLFLNDIFSKAETKISVKTRLGINSHEEFYKLIQIFNKYPIAELTIHPRVQKDFYKNKPNHKIFEEAFNISKNPVCYNGDIFTSKDYQEFTNTFPKVSSIMFGRGLLVNPSLTKTIKHSSIIEKGLLKDFHDKIYNDYKKILFGEINVLHKMKGLWFYMISIFSNNSKYAKKINKSTRLYDYEEAVSSLFKEQNILEDYEQNLLFRA